MRSVIIIAVGKLSEKFREIERDFLKRMENVRVIEIKESNRLEETRRIVKRLERMDCTTILCDAKGKLMDSKQFSELLFKFLQTKDVCFIVGGADGVEKELLSKYLVETISFSRMVFNHQLFRLMLLEQVYRAFAERKGHPYSKH